MGDKLTETSKVSSMIGQCDVVSVILSLSLLSFFLSLQTRASIQKLASEQRSELVKVKGDLSDKTKKSEKLQKEVDELKELWESEIKGKHKLTEKVSAYIVCICMVRTILACYSLTHSLTHSH